MRYPHAFAAALSPAPIGPFPPPAHRTRRADFPHRALQWDHAPRTRNAEPGTYAGPVVCVPPVLRSCTALPALNPVRRVARPVYALTTSGLPKMRGWPDSFAYACDASGLPALHAGILGRATPAGLRPSVIGPHLRPLSSAGIVGSEEAPRGADLRPPPKRLVRFSRKPLSQRCRYKSPRKEPASGGEPARCASEWTFRFPCWVDPENEYPPSTMSGSFT